MSRPAFYNRPPGACGNVEFALHFAAWMAGRPRTPHASELMARWNMSRASAYRYLRSYREAFGQVVNP